MVAKRHVLALSRDRGSVQAIVPVLEFLKNNSSYHLTVLSIGSTENIYEQFDIPYKLFDEKKFNQEPNQYIQRILSLYNPDLILMGSSPAKSTPPETPEQFLIQNACLLGVTTLAVQDCWGMYHERFFNAKNQLDMSIVPDRLCVLDRQSEHQLKELKFPIENIAITHNPWLDRVVSGVRDLPNRSNLLSNDCLNVLFVSQPLSETNQFRQRLYDQHDILEGLVDILSSEIEKARIVIWKHPAEDHERWQCLDDWKKPGVELFLTEERGAGILAHVDLIVTSHSTVVYEALYYGTPCVSFRPKDNTTGLLISDELELSKSFIDRNDFKSYLRNTDFQADRNRLLVLKQYLTKKRIFFSDGNATKRVLAEIDSLFCRN